ncbi:MAG TPA: hypothetical protein VJ418_31615 [Streptosporangiaceae bacterium]|nr:hypothetical protein [Streptosporangiaceae bacterium]
MSRRPAVVAFDVIETLMSLEPLRARLTDIGQPPGLLEAWYTRTLRDGMALSATGDYVPFSEAAEAALRGLTHYTVSDEQVAAVMAGWDELPAFPDAAPAVTRLTEAQARKAGLRVRTGLTQVPYSARGWIHKAGNDGFIKVVADADRSVLVGATSAGPWGGEVLSALQVAIRAEVPLATLRNMPYAYPTFYRAIEDALRSLEGSS